MTCSLPRKTLIVAGCAAMIPLFVCAAPAVAPPTIYSLERKAPSPHDMAVAIYRDGPRETIKLSRASGWHSQMWFDFAAHKQYVEDSNAPGKCSAITYTSDAAPELLDPIPGAFALTAEIPANAPSSGREILGGVETRVIDMGGGSKVWLDDNRHMVLKMMVVMQGNPAPQTMLDLTGIRFDKPDTAKLTPPAHCTQLTGTSNTNGGHAEEPIQH